MIWAWVSQIWSPGGNHVVRWRAGRASLYPSPVYTFSLSDDLGKDTLHRLEAWSWSVAARRASSILVFWPCPRVRCLGVTVSQGAVADACQNDLRVLPLNQPVLKWHGPLTYHDTQIMHDSKAVLLYGRIRVCANSKLSLFGNSFQITLLFGMNYDIPLTSDRNTKFLTPRKPTR